MCHVSATAVSEGSLSGLPSSYPSPPPKCPGGWNPRMVRVDDSV